MLDAAKAVVEGSPALVLIVLAVAWMVWQDRATRDQRNDEKIAAVEARIDMKDRIIHEMQRDMLSAIHSSTEATRSMTSAVSDLRRSLEALTNIAERSK